MTVYLSSGIRQPTRWVVLGAGGHARSLCDLISALNETVMAISGQPKGQWTSSARVIGSDHEAIDWAFKEGYGIALGVGGNAVRSVLAARAGSRQLALPRIIARTATVSADASVGYGSAIFEHGHIGPAASIGAGVVLNTASVVEHDCYVGDFAHIAPGARVLGGARVGRLSLVGAGAIILPGVQVGDNCVVGAGAVVTKSVESGTTVAGIPAKPFPGSPHSGGEA